MVRLEKLQLAHPASSDDILNAFLDYLIASDLEPYDHQEEAILELYEGKNVILNTPTGSGKSLVALALKFKGLCQGRRVYYTVPIKALANEKFLSLCNIFSPADVGMITGDATVNPEAPIICCTAEILSNLALREGAAAPVDDVIMDEFHYYSDHSRGTAWQIPLLTLSNSRFLLMSATLGDTSFFEKTLTELNGIPTTLIQSDQRPVPIEFEYSETQLEEKVLELVVANKAPIYLVHFTQLACARSAQNLLSSNLCSREEKREIADALEKANFRSPYGKEISKLLRHGIGIHHAGLLPKYRILVEKLTAKGLLKVICGTDTLGVGVNVPIRTVLFTQLCKFDGQGTRILSVRDFKQICGRAGRRGFDDIGYVVCQAPEHAIENLRLEQKAAANLKKRSKIVKRKPPEKGFIPWEDATFQKLIQSPPEKLASQFDIRHSMLLNVLSRPDEDGCAALKEIIDRCHEPVKRRKELKKQAFRLFRDLVGGKILDIIPPAQRTSPAKVILNVDLQEDFSLNQALALYLLDTLPLLQEQSSAYVLDLLSLIESILENPDIILRRQVDQIKTELVNQLKRDGVEYDDRMAQLDEVEWPKPNKDFIYDTFNQFSAKHPWVEGSNIRPKSIAREMFEHYQSFDDYIMQYKLERSEAVLLRHLSEVYKVLAQTIPPAAKTEDVEEAELYLEDMVRNVDSSLLDEWETLKDPHAVLTSDRARTVAREIPITRNRPAFTRTLRNAIFNFIKALGNHSAATALEYIEPADSSEEPWTTDRLETLLHNYLSERHRIRLDPEARSKKHTYITDDVEKGLWSVEQVLVDPDENNDWSLKFTIDLPKSDAAKTPAIIFEGLTPVEDGVLQQ